MKTNTNHRPADSFRRLLILPVALCLLGGVPAGATDMGDPNDNSGISSKSASQSGEARASTKWTPDRMRNAKVVKPIMLDPETLEPIKPDEDKETTDGN